MQATPPRPARRPLLLLHSESRPETADPGLFAQARAASRAALLLLFTLPCLAVQAVLVRLPGTAKARFARFYWAGFARLLGVRTRLLGTPAGGAARGGRPVVFVSNHSSWVDIAVLGGRLHACFVSKDDVARWPLVSTVARLGRTVFVSRQRGSTIRERDDLMARLAAGDNLILFPEGTTSDGARVLPFRSAFLAAATGPSAPLIQPVSIVYDRVAGLPAWRATRPLFAYYGATAIGPHFWRLAQWRGLRASVLLHPPIDPATFADRKALTKAVWQAVADGAAALRQGRLPPGFDSI